MESSIEKTVGQFSCSVCKRRLDDEIILASESGELICDACQPKNKNEVDKLIVERHKMPECRPFKKRKIEQPLQPIETMLKQDIEALKSGLQEFESFDYTSLYNIHWNKMENNVNTVVDNAIKNINALRGRVLETIKKCRERGVDSSLAQTTLGIAQLQTVSSEASAYVSTWSDRLSQSDPELNEHEIEIALEMTHNFKAKMNSIAGIMNKKAFEEIKSTLNREILGPRTIAGKTAPVRKLTCNGSRGIQVFFTPDGNLLSLSVGAANVTIWDVSSWKVLGVIRGAYSSKQTCIVALPGEMIAACTYKIYILDLKNKILIRKLSDGEIGRKMILVLKSGALVSFSSAGTLNVWNPLSGELVMTKKCYHNVMLSDHMPLLGCLSNGNLVISVRENAIQNFKFQVRDALKGTLLTNVITSEKNVSACLVLSNDLIALGTTTGAIKLIDAMNGSLLSLGIKKAHDRCVTNLIETQRGKLVSCAIDSAGLINIRVWKLQDLSLIHTYVGEEESGARISISVSPDEKYLAVVGVNTRFINIWQLE